MKVCETNSSTSSERPNSSGKEKADRCCVSSVITDPAADGRSYEMHLEASACPGFTTSKPNWDKNQSNKLTRGHKQIHRHGVRGATAMWAQSELMRMIGMMCWAELWKPFLVYNMLIFTLIYQRKVKYRAHSFTFVWNHPSLRLHSLLLIVETRHTVYKKTYHFFLSVSGIIVKILSF